jgi:hypothetical protein
MKPLTRLRKAATAVSLQRNLNKATRMIDEADSYRRQLAQMEPELLKLEADVAAGRITDAHSVATIKRMRHQHNSYIATLARFPTRLA